MFNLITSLRCHQPRYHSVFPWNKIASKTPYPRPIWSIDPSKLTGFCATVAPKICRVLRPAELTELKYQMWTLSQKVIRNYRSESIKNLKGKKIFKTIWSFLSASRTWFPVCPVDGSCCRLHPLSPIWIPIWASPLIQPNRATDSSHKLTQLLFWNNSVRRIQCLRFRVSLTCDL